MKRRNAALIVFGLFAFGTSALFARGVAATSAVATAVQVGVSRSTDELERAVDQPGPIEVTTVSAADWSVTRAGMINLAHPKAKAAQLTDGDEPIQIYFHALRHPRFGSFIIDTGVESALQNDPEHALIRGVVGKVMHAERIHVHVDTKSWLEKERLPLSGVLLTHLHLDHISGLPDIPKDVPVYVGPGETTDRKWDHLFSRGIIDRALEGRTALREFRFAPDPSQRFSGVLDVFNDGSLWAIHVPGHTRGSIAYLARTPTGPVLFTGDACHTAWGWKNGVEPGTFSSDKPASVLSLSALNALVARHPKIDVRLGHQHL